ncbi:MAG: hypothetical protein GY799_13365 [Desulfobulbaceae bacterium]|nr:hypothetical protein [Desulfobulbaceae bacterium]
MECPNTPQHDTGSNSARALAAFGINHRPLDLGPVIPPAKTLVMPESVVPLFEAPTAKDGKPYENHYCPVEPLSEFDILTLQSFAEANPLEFLRHIKGLEMGSADAARIVRRPGR